MNDSFLNNLWVRIRAEVLADRKKSAAMGVLLFVAMVLGLRLMMKGGAPPKAAAAPTAATTDEPARMTPAPRPRTSEVTAYLEQIDSRAPRDLFTTDFGVYPVAEEKPTRPGLTRTKTPSDSVLLERERQIKLVRGLAAKLKLQSTMPGDPPTAIVNGRVVRQGEQFMGFVFREIKLGSCIVAHGTIEVTLTME